MTIKPMKEPVRIEHEDGVTVYQRRTYLLPWSDLGVQSVAFPSFSSRPEDGGSLGVDREKFKELRDWLDVSCKFNVVGRIGITFSDADDAMRCKLAWAGMLTTE